MSLIVYASTTIASMKAFLLLSIVLAAGGMDTHVIELSPSQKDKAHQYTTECVKQSGVKPELVIDFRNGRFSDDEGLKKFTLCFFHKADILTSDAKLNIDVALSVLPPGFDKTGASKLLEECKNRPGKDAPDTALEIYKCFYLKAKTHVIY